MKYIICEEPGRFILKEKVIPKPKKGESLLKIDRVGVCGTDIHAYGGSQPFFNYPRILGHEVAATYIEGEAPGFVKGDALTFIPYFNCDQCIACKNGRPNCCSSIAVFGVHIDGAMAEYVVIPDQFLISGQGLNYSELALVEPLAIAAHGIRRAAVNSNDIVLVMGAGPIGLGVIQFAKLTGARVLIMDINEHRLSYCKNELGITSIINPNQDDVYSKLSQLTEGSMPTVIVDATGNQRVMNNAFGYMAHGGRYVLVGLQKGDLTFNHPEFHKRESTLLSSRNATREDFNYVIECIKSKKINAKKFITHQIQFDEMPQRFDEMFSPENKVIKALINF
ncbi:zinc-binding alcohol dehydrogenase family protein [Leeuwenhoekiella palythoae]|uniref:zinc-binding alcohol dehydrogenase family protein n=1 Tax=Leeuwenhoekiella palythoae TaxID=573501 RepID=UPI003517E8D8